MKAHTQYMARMSTLSDLELKRSGYLTMVIVLSLIGVATLVLWLTPWVQTAFGPGTVSSLNPAHRQQAISALVDGQISQWHVREGERVLAGAPIVTLVDQDPELLVRLESELASLEQQKRAYNISLETSQQELARAELLLKEGVASVDQRDKVLRQVQSIKTNIAQVDGNISKMKTVVARESSRTKFAPQDGVITRLKEGGASTSVKSGDILAFFMPDDASRSVKVQVSGLDIPLIREGRKVRLQFEGWPVFQFSGWPASAIGTFGGEVEFIDPIATPDGRFNVWVKPDPDDAPWPEVSVVRLGSRAKAWIILEEVSLAYELWRQLNSFPPKLAAEPTQ